MALAKLSIDLEARLAGLQTGMDKAVRIAEKDADRMERAFAGVRAAAASIGGALAAGLSVSAVTSFLQQTGEAATAIKRLSELSNQSASDFQRFAAGARTVGIEQDKLADIFKDTQDKVGDFLVTGAGPLADFFEKIAPRVGVTAEQFRNLGGKDALQLYVSSLEKANLSQSEMVFFLEAIASDSAHLLPLLRDNGRGFKELGDQAERLGGILSDQAVQSAAEFDRNLEKLSTRVLGLARDISGPLIKALNDLFDLGERGQRQGGGFLTGYFDQLREDYLRAREIATREQIEQARPGFERAQGILARQPDSIRAKATVADFRELEAAARRYREELQAVSASAFPQSSVQGGRGSIVPPLAGSRAAPPPGAKPGRAARPERQDIGYAITDPVNDQLVAFLRSEKDAYQALADVIEIEVPQAVQTAEQEMKQFFLQTEKDYEAVDAAVKALAETTAKTSDLAVDLGLSFSSAFEDAIVNGGSLRELLQGLEQDILRIITRQLVTQPLANSITGLLSGSGGGGGLLGSLSSFFGGFFAEGGYLAPGKVGIVGERGPELIYGGRQGMTVQPDAARPLSVYNSFQLSGPVDRRTLQQVYAAAARGVERASSRNN